MKTRIAIVVCGVVLAAGALGARQIPAVRPPVPPATVAPAPPGLPPPVGQSTMTVDVYLLAALRVQDARLEALEARLAVLEKRGGVKK